MESFGSAALRRLLEVLPDAVLATHADLGDATARVATPRILEAMALLRDDPELCFEMLTDLTAVDHLGDQDQDWEGDGGRFEVVYHLYSVEKNHRVRIKVRVSQAEPAVDSVVSLWPSANWMEREVWDLYGIHFREHPDLRRILLYDEFEGHPLRKDYPKERRQPLIGPRN
jgi:NADH-quinone oxidoreductase subunit C